MRLRPLDFLPINPYIYLLIIKSDISPDIRTFQEWRLIPPYDVVMRLAGGQLDIVVARHPLFTTLVSQGQIYLKPLRQTNLVRAMCGQSRWLKEIEATVGLWDVGANRDTGLKKETGLRSICDFYTVDLNTDMARGRKHIHALNRAV